MLAADKAAISSVNSTFKLSFPTTIVTLSAGNGETSSVNFCSTRAAAALYVSNFPATEYTANNVPLAR